MDIVLLLTFGIPVVLLIVVLVRKFPTFFVPRPKEFDLHRYRAYCSRHDVYHSKFTSCPQCGRSGPRSL